jgi:hypothetical protein
MISSMTVYQTTHAAIANARKFETDTVFYVADLIITGRDVCMVIRLFGDKPFTNSTLMGTEPVVPKPHEASFQIHGVKSIRMEKWTAVDDPDCQWNVLLIDTDRGSGSTIHLHPQEVRQDTVVLY